MSNEEDERTTSPADCMSDDHRYGLVRAANFVAMACGITREQLAEVLEPVTVKPQYENSLDVIREGQDLEGLSQAWPEGSA